MSDTDFLKDYVARNPNPIAPPPPSVTSSTENADVTQSLEETVADKNNTSSSKVKTSNQQKLHNKAVDQDANDKEKQARLEQEAQEQRLAEEEQAKREKNQNIKNTASDIASKVDSAVQPFIDKIANLKTVGGIGLLIAILVFLNFVVIQVNSSGDTRLKQLWYMLNGQAQIQGRVIPTAVTGGGASADFGNTTSTTTGTTVQPVVSTASSNGFSNQSSFRNFTGSLN